MLDASILLVCEAHEELGVTYTAKKVFVEVTSRMGMNSLVDMRFWPRNVPNLLGKGILAISWRGLLE